VASINAVGVYSQLVAAHVGPRGAAAAGLEARDADAAARIEVAQSRVADLAAGLPKSMTPSRWPPNAAGRTVPWPSCRISVTPVRPWLQSERTRRANWPIKTERTALAARGRAAEAEAAPIIYVAQLFGLVLANRSDIDLNRQVTAPGATWLDYRLVERERMPLAMSGFGQEVRNAIHVEAS
jgi:Protein of unknown function (DUF3363)